MKPSAKNSPDSLASLRGQIDALDERILALLNRRMTVVGEIGRLKSESNDQILDAAREHQVLDRLRVLNGGPLSAADVSSIFREVMSAARRLQRPASAAYFGPEATFTHLAALKYFGQGTTLVPQPNIKEVFASVEHGRTEFGVVPVENSTEGVVNYTLDLLYTTSLNICGEIYIEVEHYLVSAGAGQGEIKCIYSHPQPLAQCREWLAAKMPGVPLMEARSTADAARKAKEEPGVAAITSSLAAQIYGLDVIAERIEDNPRNFTRFAVLGRRWCRPTGVDKTSLLFCTEDLPGALFSALAPFARRAINLTKLESRPMKAQAWRYIFFVDLQGHSDDPVVAETITELERCCRFVKLLGSYPRADDQERFAR
ncbi:MAG: prephenate dehydratase [Pseudomonadota bacterium]